MARTPAKAVIDHARFSVLCDIHDERERQDAKWGEQNHPDGTGGGYAQARASLARIECEAAFERDEGTWWHILNEEYREAMAERDPLLLRAELIQLAAVAVSWIEAIDRRTT